VKVLHVEDHPDVQRAVFRVLKRTFDQLDPWVADRADLAIEYLRDAELTAPCDLVICDWDLNGKETGKAVLTWIREHCSRLESKFLFFTANDAGAHQGVAYLEKPSDTETLRTAIMALLKPTEQRS
jgi:DNA-binding response OmpR family regulator